MPGRDLFGESSAFHLEPGIAELLRETQSRRRGKRGSMTAEQVRAQELPIIGINILALLGIALVSILLPHPTTMPAGEFEFLLLARVGIQIFEGWWLLTRKPLPDRLARVYGVASVWLHVAFAALVAGLERSPDTHFIVLTVIPIVAAAFRFRALGVAMVVISGVAITLGEVAISAEFFESVDKLNREWFEAVSVALVLVLIGGLLCLLVGELRREQGRLTRSLGSLEKTRDKLIRRERLATVGKLASAMAHEIRNPIAMIASSVATMRKKRNTTGGASTATASGDASATGSGSSRTEERLFGVIEQETRRLETMTRDLLTLARNRPPELQQTRVATTLGYMRELTTAFAKERGIGIDDVIEGDPVARYDPHQIIQALHNLVRNAIEASPEGGRVLLRAAVEEGSLVMQVANPAEPIQRPDEIFEPFHSAKPDGTGLGLPIARRIAEGHGGTLRLTHNEGGWVAFTLRLPMLPTDPDSIPTHESHPDLPGAPQ